MSEPKAALIYSPLPDAETARGIAGALLDEGLIACANIFASVESVFVWEGKRESASETGLLLKTTAEKLDRAVSRLAALHPYATPVIVGQVCDTAHPDTLEWLAQQTR